ncbi:MAG: magnesium transporter CorA family protein [Bacteroidales bacterium]|jgi:magnesium transporter|nr:magnesium transporter CorA family protein [Bacteroidales bacterium]
MVETLKFGTLKWHNIPNPIDDDIDFLLDEFHFHPLAIEDCMSSTNQRPKIDVYDDYYFLILHFPYLDKQNKFLRIREVKIFWGENYIITIGKAHWTVLEMFEEAKQSTLSEDNNEDFMFGSSDQLLYRIMQKMMEETYKLVRRIGIGIDYINTEMFDNKADRSIENISISRKNVILLNTTFKPQVRLFHKFESGEIKGYADNMEEYWSNILDYVQKIWDMTEDFGELIESLSKTFDSMQANRTNEIIKILTFFSSVLLPLTFITGLYGMNVNLPFGESRNAFILLIGVMIVTIVGMLLFFKRKRWL